MCGRFVQIANLFAGLSPWPELADDFADIPDRYNLAPTQRRRSFGVGGEGGLG